MADTNPPRSPQTTAAQPSRVSALDPLVWAVRRDLGRLLGAMFESGIGLDAIGADDQARLQRCEAITARFLATPEAMLAEEVRAASLELRSVERDIVRRLGRASLAKIRQHQEDISGCESALLSSICAPAKDVDDKVRSTSADGSLRSLSAALERLSHRRLHAVMERLGVSGGPSPTGAFDEGWSRAWRRRSECSVARKLRDEGLLRILVATLNDDARRLLRAIALKELAPSLRERLSLTAYAARSMGGPQVESPIQSLCECGIVFAERGELWIPHDLYGSILRILTSEGPKPRFLV